MLGANLGLLLYGEVSVMVCFFRFSQPFHHPTNAGIFDTHVDIHLSNDVAAESVIKPYIKNDNPLVD